MKLTEKQKAFADYYIETLNATESAIKAGYSDKTASEIGYENLRKPHIKKYIETKMSQKEKDRIASQDEVLEFLTKGIRMQLEEETVVVEGMGVGRSEAKKINKKISLREAIKCAELLGKRYIKFEEEKIKAVIEKTKKETVLIEEKTKLIKGGHKDTTLLEALIKTVNEDD